MRKIVGLCLLSLSFLFSALIVAITKISVTLKQISFGNYGINNIGFEIPVLSYILVAASIVIALSLIIIGLEKDSM